MEQLNERNPSRPRFDAPCRLLVEATDWRVRIQANFCPSAGAQYFKALHPPYFPSPLLPPLRLRPLTL